MNPAFFNRFIYKNTGLERYLAAVNDINPGPWTGRS